MGDEDRATLDLVLADLRLTVTDMSLLRAFLEQFPFDAIEYLLNHSFAVGILEQGAEDGIPFAENRFAALLIDGIHTKRDHTRALRFLDSSRDADRPLLYEIYSRAKLLLEMSALFEQRRLLASGVTPLVRTGTKDNLLHLGARRGQIEVVATLYNRYEFDKLVSAKNDAGLRPYDVVSEEAPHTHALRSVLSISRFKRALLVLFALKDWVPREIASLIAKDIAPPREGEGDLNEPMLSLANSWRVW